MVVTLNRTGLMLARVAPEAAVQGLGLVLLQRLAPQILVAVVVVEDMMLDLALETAAQEVPVLSSLNILNQSLLH